MAFVCVEVEVEGDDDSEDGVVTTGSQVKGIGGFSMDILGVVTGLVGVEAAATDPAMTAAAAAAALASLILILCTTQWTRRSHPCGPWMEASLKLRVFCQTRYRR